MSLLLLFNHYIVSDSLWPNELHAAHQASLSFTISQSFLKHVHGVSDAIQPFHPLWPLLLLPSIFPSIRVFSNESALHIRGPKYWSFNFSTSFSNEYSGLISFRIDWFHLLQFKVFSRVFSRAPQFKAPVLWHSAFFIVQLSHSYMTTGKTTALTRRTFVGKVMSLLFQTLSRFVTAFLPRSKWLLISWLQSPSTLILETKKMKSDTVSTFSPTICHEVIGPDAMIFIFLLLVSLAKNIKQEMSTKMRYNIIIFI